MYFRIKSVLIWILLIAINEFSFTYALRIEHLKVPSAVVSGENATLTCNYDLEGDELYSVKWYKGYYEFYRFIPQQEPKIRIFQLGPANKINVDITQSNASTVVLTDMQPGASGRYSCEVSADAPSFQTEIASATMNVVDIPSRGPKITFDNHTYRIGDILVANCTVLTHTPAINVNLTWLINNQEWLINNQTGQPLLRVVKALSSDTSDAAFGYYSIMLKLKLVLQPRYFRLGKLMLGCKATTYDVYNEIVEQAIYLDEKQNQIFDDTNELDLYDERKISGELDNITMSRWTDDKHAIRMHASSKQNLPNIWLTISLITLGYYLGISTSF